MRILNNRLINTTDSSIPSIKPSVAAVSPMEARSSLDDHHGTRRIGGDPLRDGAQERPERSAPPGGGRCNGFRVRSARGAVERTPSGIQREIMGFGHTRMVRRGQMTDAKDISNSDALKFVLMLGVSSLCADMAYEGARSITGPYLAVLGASATVVGTVAGFGELVGYGLRLFSGYISDRTGKYWAVTLSGYFLNMVACHSSCSRSRCSLPRFRCSSPWQGRVNILPNDEAPC